MHVELKTHTGYRHVRGQRVEVELPQQIVVADGVHVAYTGREPQAPLNFNRHYPDAFIAHVADEVARLKGGEASVVTAPPDPAVVAQARGDEDHEE